MAINVRNASRTTFVINLLAGVDYGDDYKPTKFAMDRSTTTEDGTTGIEHVRKDVPGSITWLPGETKSVPKAVDEIEQFRTAVAQGTLVVVDKTAAPAAPSTRVSRPARGEGDSK